MHDELHSGRSSAWADLSWTRRTCFANGAISPLSLITVFQYHNNSPEIINEQNTFSVPKNCCHHFPSGVDNFGFLWSAHIRGFPDHALSFCFRSGMVYPCFISCYKAIHEIISFFRNMSSKLRTAAILFVFLRQQMGSSPTFWNPNSSLTIFPIDTLHFLKLAQKFHQGWRKIDSESSTRIVLSVDVDNLPLHG